MSENTNGRIQKALTPEQQAALAKNRALIAKELPDLIEKDRLRKEASEENTLSGEIRRAVHARGNTVAQTAAAIGISPLALDEFLTGERTLRSDVLDRLATLLHLSFAAHP